MYNNKVFKNYQVNVGMPIQIRTPVNLSIVRSKEDDSGSNKAENSESAEDMIARSSEEAEYIIKEARLEAERLMEEARVQIEEMKAGALEDARIKGYDEGYREAMEQYEGLIHEAEDIRDSARLEYDDVLKGIEADAVELVLKIARKVISSEISVNKKLVLELAAQAFNRCSNRDNVVLKVSKEDYDYVIENQEQLLAMCEGMGELEIKKDVSLKEGACLVETPFGSIDAGVETKLKKIEAAFKECCQK